MSNSLDSIRVAIRVRPLIKRENDCKDNWLVDGDTICQIHDGKKVPNTTFTFDRIFSKHQSTVDLYMDFAKPIVLSVMEGINGTLFAYGQTSSGKTYTMSGSMDTPGIIPYALDEVFNYISKTQNREFLLRVSYMEIYNEIITDLLNPKSTNLKIRENVDREISVEKLMEKVVTSVADVMDVMTFGEKNRHIGGTNMNERSSRSHTIFRMVAESRETHSRNSVENGEFDGAVKVSHLNLVDLAGSERASVTGAEGIRLREGGFINKSLFALGNVINKLSEGESTFVPFRDSKLTRILQNSLGGNAKTSIICAVTPASTDETLSTLQFASRAKRIKNRPEVNEVLDDGTMLKRYRREINVLKRKLEKSHSREEVLKREMELQMEKDMIQKELEEQRKVAEETKAKLRDLANIFCTAQPKESESKQRKQRRWTVCPMGAHRKPLLQLDLPFDGEFGRPSRRLERTFAGSPSKGLGEEVNSADFNVDSHKQFLDDLQEREDETIADQSVLSSVEEHRNSFNSANNSGAKIAELELEVKRLTEERDMIRNDLSENISSSCEMQEDLLKTKDKLKEKKQENRALQERSQQLEALCASSEIDDSENNNIFEQKLLKYKAENEALNTKLEAAVSAKEEAVTKCQDLQKQQTELEEKVELLNVIQDELTTVDTLQEEFVQEQERNKTLQEEIRKSEDDKAILRQELELHLGNIAANQKCSVVLEGKVLTLNDENIELRMKLEELAAVNNPEKLNEEIEALKTRLQEMEAQNTELRDSCHQFEEKCHRLQYEFDEKLSLPVETNTQGCSEDALKAKESEIAELQERIEQLTEKLSRKRRRASNHTSDMSVSSITPETESESIVLNLLEELSKAAAVHSPDSDRRRLDDVIIHVKNYLSGWDVTGNENAEDESSSSSAEQDVLDSTICRELVEIKQLRRASSVVQVLEARETKNDDDKSDTIKDLEKQLAEALESKQALAEQYDGFVEGFANETKFELDEKDAELARQSEELRQLREQLARELAMNTELEEKVMTVEALREDCVKPEEFTEQLAQSSSPNKKLEARKEESQARNEEFSARKEESPIQKEEFGERNEEFEARKEEEFEARNEDFQADNEDFPTQNVNCKEKLKSSSVAKEELVQYYESYVENLRHDYYAELMKREEMFTEAERKRDEELTRKDATLQEMTSELQRLKAQLGKVELTSTILPESKAIPELNMHIGLPLSPKCQSESQESPERKRKHSDELTVVEDRVKATPDAVERKRLKDDKIAQINEQFDEIGNLKRLLELAFAAKEAHEESMAKLQQEFGGKLSEKDKELQDLMEKVKQLKEKLHDTNDTSTEKTSTEKTSTEDIIVTEVSVNELRNKFEQEILQKDTELQQKSLKIENLENLSASQYDKEHEEMTERIKKLQEELYQRNEQLHEKICETEHLKLLIGSQSDNELQEEIPPCDVNIQEKTSEELGEVNSDCEKYDLKRQLIEAREANERMLLENDINIAELQKKYQAEIAEKTKNVQDKSKEIDCLTRKLKCKMLTLVENPEVEALEEEINMLEDELEAANNLVKEREIRVSEMETRSCEEINILKEKLEAVVSEKENLVKENEARRVEVEAQYTEEISMLKKELEAVISEKNNLLKAKESSIADVETRFHVDISLLKEELEAVDSEKENLVKENETRLVEMETQFHEEISLLNEKLEAAVSEKGNLEKENEARVSEVETQFREKLEKIVSENEGVRKELAELQGKYDFELAEKDFEIGKILSTREKLESELQETISSKESLIAEYEATIARMKDEFTKEIDQMRCTAEGNAKEILELQGKLTKTEKSSVEIEELLLKLKEKSDLVAELEEKVKALVESKESLLEQHQTTSDRLQQDFDDQIESIRQAVEEKERELARAQEENVNTLRAELDRERERLNEVVNESASQIREFDNKILDKEIQYEESLVENQKLKEQVENLVSEAKQMSKDFGEKTNRVSELESELVKAAESSESLARERDSLTRLTEERDSLQNDLNSTAENLNRIRNDRQAKSDEISTLEERVNETNQAMESLKNENKSMVEDLQQQNNSLKTDLEKLFEENQNLKIDSETYQDQLRELKEQNNLVHEAQNEMDSFNMETQPSEASCKNCRRRSGARQGRRESEVFKLMLEDIKEQVGNEHAEQDKLIDELNHTLVATQERLEQKEFVLDEKEIEIMERDELVEQLQELAAAVQLSASQEKEELLQAKQESEKAIEKLTYERNALQEKFQDYESVLSEEQLRELYNAKEEKSQRITDLEQELSEMHKKDSKICELEMEIDILQGEITSFKGRSDGDQQSIRELQQMIREQETHIVQLEACKAGLTLERDETIAGQLRDLRVELDGARSHLAGFEEERNRGMKVMQEKTELLAEYEVNIAMMEENIQNKDKELCEVSKKLEKALEDVNEKDVSGQRTVQELKMSKVELKELKNSFETVSDELQHVKIELQEHDEVIKKLNSDVQVAEGAFKEAMSDKFETDEIVKVKEVECKGYKEKIRDLEIQQKVQSKELEAMKLRHISVSDEYGEHREKFKNIESQYKVLMKELENEKSRHSSTAGELEKCKAKIMQLDQQYRCRIAELTTQNTDKTTTAGCQGNQEQISKELEAKDKELANLDEQVNKSFRIVRKKEKECAKLNKALQECEDEITDFKNQIEKLEDENEELKKKFQNKDSDINIQQEQSREADTLRSKVSSLEAEVQYLRKRSDVNLEEELKKAKNELKTKELDLFHVNFEKTKQLDIAMSKICELEKDIANYARKNNDLKAEIRSLRNREEEPTIDLIRSKPPSSSNGENVGVVGTVALFTLNARVEKLTDENKQLQTKSETLQKEVDKLGIINLDLKQRYGQITEKYNRLKEKFVSVLETQQKMEEVRKTEQNTGAELQAIGQQVQPVIKSQNNDPTFRQPPALSNESTSCQPTFNDNKPEFKEQVNRPGLKDGSSEFRPHMGKSAFKPSTESAFRKPLNVSAVKPSSTEVKPAGPIPSHQASKPACSSVGLPRRVEPKQSGAMQASRKQTAEVGSKQTAGATQASNQASRATKEQSTFDKSRKTTFSKQNKENSLYNSQEKPDACKSQ